MDKNRVFPLMGLAFSIALLLLMFCVGVALGLKEGFSWASVFAALIMLAIPGLFIYLAISVLSQNETAEPNPIGTPDGGSADSLGGHEAPKATRSQDNPPDEALPAKPSKGEHIFSISLIALGSIFYAVVICQLWIYNWAGLCHEWGWMETDADGHFPDHISRFYSDQMPVLLATSLVAFLLLWPGFAFYPWQKKPQPLPKENWKPELIIQLLPCAYGIVFALSVFSARFVYEKFMCTRHPEGSFRFPVTPMIAASLGLLAYLLFISMRLFSSGDLPKEVSGSMPDNPGIDAKGK